MEALYPTLEEPFKLDNEAAFCLVVVGCTSSVFIILTVYYLTQIGQKYIDSVPTIPERVRQETGQREERRTNDGTGDVQHARGDSNLGPFDLQFSDLNREERQEKPEEKNGVSKKKGKQGADKRNTSKSQYSHSWLAGTLKGHNGEVTDCDFSSNNKYMATCAEGKRRKRKGRRKNPKPKSPLIEECALQEKLPPIKIIIPDIVAKPLREWNPLYMYETLPFDCDKLYPFLLTYILSRTELEMYGYPLDGPMTQNSLFTSGHSYYCPSNESPEIKTCCRCRSQFKIVDGQYTASDDCRYHWGEKTFVTGKQVYRCCSKEIGNPGCTTGPYHVCQQTFKGVKGFVKTQPLNPSEYIEDIENIADFGIYALDCEMCFTVNGLEVTKVSVVGADGVAVYDKYVLPESPILDYNTPFSGITEAHLKNVSTKLSDVQKDLLQLFNSRTILIGHSLESDLKVLRMIHETVIDTSVVFPHRLGLPFRRSLKALVSAYLQKQMHNRFGGHDSVEDSRACMELMLYKVHTDWKLALKELQLQQIRFDTFNQFSIPSHAIICN